MTHSAFSLRPRRLIETVRDPWLAGRYAASAWQSRVTGPLRAHRRPGAVAIFHVGRCGSTVLTDLLDQHSSIRSDGETYVRVLEAARVAGLDPAAAGVDPVEYVADRLPRSGNRWFMYDLKFDHVTRLGSTLGEYVHGVRAVGVDRFVVLRRRNLLRKLVSGLMAGERGSYHSTDPAAVEPIRVHVSVDAVSMDGHIDSVIGHFDRVERLYEQFWELTLELDVLELEYESDVLSDPEVAYEYVCAFLGLDPEAVEVRLQRLNPFALAELIDNFDEVAAALNGTSYAWMLDC